MSRVLVVFAAIAFAVSPSVSYADPHDHDCVGPVDQNCYNNVPGHASNCDVYFSAANTIFCWHA